MNLTFNRTTVKPVNVRCHVSLTILLHVSFLCFHNEAAQWDDHCWKGDLQQIANHKFLQIFLQEGSTWWQLCYWNYSKSKNNQDSEYMHSENKVVHLPELLAASFNESWLYTSRQVFTSWRTCSSSTTYKHWHVINRYYKNLSHNTWIKVHSAIWESPSGVLCLWM